MRDRGTGRGKGRGSDHNNGPLCGIGLWNGQGVSTSKTYIPFDSKIPSTSKTGQSPPIQLWTITLTFGANLISTTTVATTNLPSTSSKVKTTATTKRPRTNSGDAKTGSSKGNSGVAKTGIVQTKSTRFGEAVFSSQGSSTTTRRSTVVHTPGCVVQ
ncbi:uncharacterized protein [Coffea arabica]|uniref:Uncharacterized protein isoform X2 n=1 Tax=Coffea arabica TaxID=13443 RepID=A0ABM4UWH7_COFAR